jgi:hypothetical protein
MIGGLLSHLNCGSLRRPASCGRHYVRGRHPPAGGPSPRPRGRQGTGAVQAASPPGRPARRWRDGRGKAASADAAGREEHEPHLLLRIAGRGTFLAGEVRRLPARTPAPHRRPHGWRSGAAAEVRAAADGQAAPPDEVNVVVWQGQSRLRPAASRRSRQPWCVHPPDTAPTTPSARCANPATVPRSKARTAPSGTARWLPPSARAQAGRGAYMITATPIRQMAEPMMS